MEHFCAVFFVPHYYLSYLPVKIKQFINKIYCLWQINFESGIEKYRKGSTTFTMRWAEEKKRCCSVWLGCFTTLWILNTVCTNSSFCNYIEFEPKPIWVNEKVYTITSASVSPRLGQCLPVDHCGGFGDCCLRPILRLRSHIGNLITLSLSLLSGAL